MGAELHGDQPWKQRRRNFRITLVIGDSNIHSEVKFTATRRFSTRYGQLITFFCGYDFREDGVQNLLANCGVKERRQTVFEKDLYVL